MRLLVVHPGASWAVADVWRGYTKALERAGHELVHYALAGRIRTAGGWLHYSWKHSGLPKEQRPTKADILYAASQFALERALRHRVDWVLVISAMYLHPDAIMLLRRAGLRVAILMTESPYDDDNQVRVAALCNAVFTNERTSVERFRTVCPSSHYLAHAYDPEVHFPHPVNDDTPAHDVLMVGTGFQERCEILAQVNWDGIDLGLYGAWPLLGSRNKLRAHLRGGIVGNDKVTDMYQAAKIGLNIHRTSVGFGKDAPRIGYAESLNPRVYELAACGCFCVTDWRAELSEIFDELIPTFQDGADLEEELRYWLDVPADDRHWHTLRMREAVREHTFDARARELVKALEST